jgi:Sporulation lipoprotein YhcN/YlaJ (Spore_YhcN_YlaJ)
MKKYWIYIIGVCFIIVQLSGCSTVNRNENSLLSQTDPEPIAVKDEDIEKVKKIKDTVLSFDEIYETAVVLGKEDCLVAIKVHHLKRFRMKAIEKKLKKKLKEQFPKDKFTVSSDYKIFLESVRLKNRVEQENWSEEQKEKRLQEIIKLSQEQT